MISTTCSDRWFPQNSVWKPFDFVSLRPLWNFFFGLDLLAQVKMAVQQIGRSWMGVVPVDATRFFFVGPPSGQEATLALLAWGLCAFGLLPPPLAPIRTPLEIFQMVPHLPKAVHTLAHEQAPQDKRKPYAFCFWGKNVLCDVLGNKASRGRCRGQGANA